MIIFFTLTRSTASPANRGDIHEVFYERPTTPGFLITANLRMNDKIKA